MKDCLNLMAALSENMLTLNMILSVFFIPGTLAGCGITPHLRITTPRELEALSGSCLEIPCIYDTEDNRYNSSQPIYGVWMKGGYMPYPDIIIFNGSGSVNNYSLNISGNLREKYCTTLFPDLKTSYADRYFFRIENEPFKATACDDPLQITVKDSPWSPSIKISVGDLNEHQSVILSCSAVTPCPHSPPELTWNLQQDSEKKTEKNPDGTFITKIQETITLSDPLEGYIRCSARYPVNGGFKTAETKVTLNVSSSNSPSGLLSAGSWMELSCSSRAKPPASFNWFWNDTNVVMNVAERGECYKAINHLGNNTLSRTCFDDKDAPRNTSASISPSGLVSAGSWVELSCSSKANPPANFTWFRNTKNGTKKVATSDFYSFRATEDGEYYCEATNDQGNQRSSILFLSVKDNAVFGLHIILKILGTILLCSTVVIFEW
ncbi:PREDICTED: myelin-associated glycoprotein-like [Cyprinodon variegatus]|uniref:myelin-associated glycoprotein-like n=1 Tax=Cyprinodon variegatus TaxID=28743 RepID=UPI000742BCC1|nr:PREDICTED: myelin-associated glycoprotein-like [Cyprinodon variegatus]